MAWQRTKGEIDIDLPTTQPDNGGSVPTDPEAGGWGPAHTHKGENPNVVFAAKEPKPASGGSTDVIFGS